MKRVPTMRSLSIEGFNLAVDIGDVALYRNDDGKIFKTRTRSKAAVLGGHTPVVWLEGKSGCVALERVSPPDGQDVQEWLR
jgi:hypothetical protein